MLPVTKRKAAFAGVLGVVLAGAFAAPASAAVFCVAPETKGCPGGQLANLQQGLDAALGAPGPDTVQLAEGTVIGPGFYDSADANNTVSVVGAGRDRTILTSPTSTASGYSLDLRNSSTLSDLTLKQFIPEVPSQDPLLLYGKADRVGLSSATDSGLTALYGTSRHIRMDGPGQINVSGTLEDSEITGGLLYTGTSNTVIRRVRVVSPQGVTGQNQTLTISSSLIVMTSPSGTILHTEPVGLPSAHATTVFSNLTLIGSGGAGCVGISVFGVNGIPPPNDFAVEDATIENTVVRNCRTTLVRDAKASGATANVTVKNSDIDLSPVAVTQTGAGTLSAGAGNLSADPLFVGLNGVDQELRFSSPLVDAGLTDPLSPAESATDLDGNPRVVDGNGDGVATRDIGAFEYQRRPPVVTTAVASPTTPVGQAVTFFGSATESDPGETVTGLAWRFDDGGAATGSDAPHAFATAGKHTATLTATDTAGVTASATASVFVLAPGVPAVTSIVLTPTTFRAASRRLSAAAKKKTKRPPVGTKVRLVVGAPVAVKLRVQHLLAGRRSGKSCAAPSQEQPPRQGVLSHGDDARHDRARGRRLEDVPLHRAPEREEARARPLPAARAHRIDAREGRAVPGSCADAVPASPAGC